VCHHFIDEFSVTEPLTAADFERRALGYLEEIFRKRPVAVVCGGTGLYIRALCEGLDEMPPVDPAVEASVQAEYRRGGLTWLQEAVQKEDPDFFAQGEIHNPARLLRALIFRRSTGESILSFRTRTAKPRPFRTVQVGLELPRNILYERINLRVDQMMEQGLLEEVRALYPLRHLKNLQTVGYAELFGYLDGHCGLPEAVERIKQHTRNYAKRQMTWFRKEGMHWLRADEPGLVRRIRDLLHE
jgi:tRNA dimethylallyltransferase